MIFPKELCPGITKPYLRLYDQIQRLRHGDLPVLIHGETGVGKEMVARTLHASPDRRGGPFLAVNCSAIPKDLLEAELFGVGKAVATGVEARRGIFEQADGGTLLLDEIGDMATTLQAKLLRVLQEGEVRPLGGRARRIDVRILSTTNADLAKLMDLGEFRPDLYYRLAGAVLVVPALRSCREDIPRLVQHFLELSCRKIGTPVQGLSAQALERLVRYPWPGNVRELAHEVRRLVCQARSSHGSRRLPDHRARPLRRPGRCRPHSRGRSGAAAGFALLSPLLWLSDLETGLLTSRRAFSVGRKPSGVTNSASGRPYRQSTLL